MSDSENTRKVSGYVHDLMCYHSDTPNIKKCHWCLRRYMHTHKRLYY